jgi:hypothetical protein
MEHKPRLKPAQGCPANCKKNGWQVMSADWKSLASKLALVCAKAAAEELASGGRRAAHRAGQGSMASPPDEAELQHAASGAGTTAATEPVKTVLMRAVGAALLAAVPLVITALAQRGDQRAIGARPAPRQAGW